MDINDSYNFISLKEAVPPFNTGVIITDGSDVSFGRICEIKTGKKAGTNDPIVSYEWRSIEPTIFKPTHWMHLPKINKK